MKCVISGSFRKYYDSIAKAIEEFESGGVRVLSPKKSVVVNPGEEFAILASDTSKDIKVLETNHLEAIRKCDFLFVCNPAGYIGASALLEIGFAIACKKRIFCLEESLDLTIRCFVDKIGSTKEIINYAKAQN